MDITSYFSPQITKSLLFPEGLEAYCLYFEPILIIGGVLLGWQMQKLKNKFLYLSFFSIVFLLICSVSINFVLQDDYLVEYGGQLFSSENNIDRLDDKVIVTLPLIRQDSLEDYYPGGKLYPETPGMQAQEKFRQYKWLVLATKALYLISFILIIALRTTLASFFICKVFINPKLRSIFSKLFL